MSTLRRNTGCKMLTTLCYCTANQLLVHFIPSLEMCCLLMFFRKRHVYNDVIITTLRKECITNSITIRSPSFPYGRSLKVL